MSAKHRSTDPAGRRRRRSPAASAAPPDGTESETPPDAGAAPPDDPAPVAEDFTVDLGDLELEADFRPGAEPPVDEAPTGDDAPPVESGDSDHPDLADGADAPRDDDALTVLNGAAHDADGFEGDEGPAAPDDAPAAPARPAPPAALKPALEALLFVAPEPMTPARLARLLGDAEIGAINAAARDLQQDYDAQGRAFAVVQVARGWQLLTRPEYAPWVEQLRRIRQEARVTPAGLQTLSIVAYKQPLTRAEVDVIRGADSGPHLRQLLDKGLVKTVGRKKVPGSPLLYGTTRRFLQQFGLKSVKDLPQAAEFRGDEAAAS